LNGDYAAEKQLLGDALRVDPLFFPARMNLGDILRESGDVDGAIREHSKVLEQDSEMLYGIVFLARAYIDKGEPSKARLVLEGSRPADRENYWMRLAWALLNSVEGRRDEALKELDGDVLKFASLVPIQLSWVTDSFGALGDTDRALESLERGMRLGDDRADWYRRDPHLAKIRSHPRFKQVLDSMDLRRAQRKTP
jgi:lipopolysaccharide biosynthesis regulator YciM